MTTIMTQGDDPVKHIIIPGLVISRTGEDRFSVAGEYGAVDFSLAEFRSRPKNIFNELLKIRGND